MRKALKNHYFGLLIRQNKIDIMRITVKELKSNTKVVYLDI
jgi:hypothetical protein